MIICKTLLKHYKSPHSTISILKRMYRLKPLMHVNNIIKRLMLYRIILFKQQLDLSMHIFGGCRNTPSDLIRQAFVVTDCKPILETIRSPRLKNQMQLLDNLFRKSLFSLFNYHVNTSKMIDCLDHIIYICTLALKTNGVGFKNTTSLVMRQPAALNMI